MVRGLVVAAVACSLGGCASVVRGTDEDVTFASEPSGAAMATNRGFSCATTPCSLQIPRDQEFDATFTLAGYQPKTISVRTKLSGGGAAGLAGNILLGGVVGAAVDAGTGAALDHVPNPVVAQLVPVGGPAGPARRPRKRPAA